jgi:hypothetical protein
MQSIVHIHIDSVFVLQDHDKYKRSIEEDKYA